MISCAPDKTVVGLPLDYTALQDDFAGVLIRTRWAVDKPMTEYTFRGDLSVNGQTTARQNTYLDGSAEGQLHPAKMVVSKTAPAGVTPLVGEELTCTVTTKSSELLRTAYGVVTTDALPASAALVSATADGVPANGLRLGRHWTLRRARAFPTRLRSRSARRQRTTS